MAEINSMKVFTRLEALIVIQRTEKVLQYNLCAHQRTLTYSSDIMENIVCTNSPNNNLSATQKEEK